MQGFSSNKENRPQSMALLSSGMLLGAPAHSPHNSFYIAPAHRPASGSPDALSEEEEYLAELCRTPVAPRPWAPARSPFKSPEGLPAAKPLRLYDMAAQQAASQDEHVAELCYRPLEHGSGHRERSSWAPSLSFPSPVPSNPLSPLFSDGPTLTDTQRGNPSRTPVPSQTLSPVQPMAEATPLHTAAISTNSGQQLTLSQVG